MLVNEDVNRSKYQIQSYSTTGAHPGIKINQVTYTQSVIIQDDQLILWRPACFAELQISDFDIFFKKPPRILLLGTGAHLHIPKMCLLRPLFEQGIGVEFMNSDAASRTYSILSAENRDVAIGLIII